MGSLLSARAAFGRALRGGRAALGGSAIVLAYHRVASPERDPYQLAVSREHFAEQIAYLATEHTVLRASELVSLVRAHERLPRRAVVVTFDDGYADLLPGALPVLEAHSVPATVFVSTVEIGSTRERWWDELASLLGEDQAPDAAEYDRLRPMPESEREAALDDIASRVGVARPHRAEYRALSGDEIRRLATSPLVDIGSHTVSHRPLSAMSSEEQHLEVSGGRQTLEALLGEPVTLFAYPFGGEDAIGPESPGIVEDAGASAAFTTQFGLVFPSSDPYLLPRCHTEDIGAEEFSALLAHWFSLGR